MLMCFFLIVRQIHRTAYEVCPEVTERKCLLLCFSNVPFIMYQQISKLFQKLGKHGNIQRRLEKEFYRPPKKGILLLFMQMQYTISQELKKRYVM